MGHLSEALIRKQALDLGGLVRKAQTAGKQLSRQVRHGKPKKTLGQKVTAYKNAKPVEDIAMPAAAGTGILAYLVAAAKSQKKDDE